MPPLVCGIDEAGRGPWAGPVCAGIVLAQASHIPPETDDSKRLTPLKRETLARAIMQTCLWSLGWASPSEIDRLNIRRATHLAMQRAAQALLHNLHPNQKPDLILVDGNDPPDLALPCRAIIGGDSHEASIAAASILAKTARDRFMHILDTLYPDYGFAQHKGYGVPLHMAALSRLGPCPAHRFSYRPVRRICQRTS